MGLVAGSSGVLFAAHPDPSPSLGITQYIISLQTPPALMATSLQEQRDVPLHQIILLVGEALRSQADFGMS